MGVACLAQNKKHHKMTHQVKIEKEDDGKTYWVPIPIQRVDAPIEGDQRNKPAQGFNNAVNQPGSQKPVNIRINQPTTQTQQKNNYNEEDDIFPRKRRSDLYGEIESRKFLS